MFGEYGTFLPIYLCHPSARTRSRVQACPASKLPCKEESNEDYNARHDLHVLKPSVGEYGHERKSDGTTTSLETSYDHGDCLDDSLTGFTLYEARKLRSLADRLKGNGDEVEISVIYLHAGLKFLKGAYLLECCIIPTSRPSDAPRALHIYSNAAKLFKLLLLRKPKNSTHYLAFRANVVLIFSGRTVKYFSNLHKNLGEGVDGWAISLKGMMSIVVLLGLVIRALYWGVNTFVLNDPSLPRLQCKNMFLSPNEYSSFVGDFSTATGITTFTMMLLGQVILKKFGCGVVATITPTVLLLTGVGFFSLILFGEPLAPLLGKFGMTPLLTAIYVGALQNIFNKSSKYGLFDPC